MYKNLALLFIFTLIYGCSEPVEEIESDSFLNIAGARVGLASQQPIDWDFSSHRSLHEYGSSAQLNQGSIVW